MQKNGFAYTTNTNEFYNGHMTRDGFDACFCGLCDDGLMHPNSFNRHLKSHTHNENLYEKHMKEEMDNYYKNGGL